MILIGLTGNAGSGKDTFAEAFHSYGFRQYSFAAPVKEACKALFLLSDFDVTDRHAKEEVHPYWHSSPRTLLQFFGTEMCREKLGHDFWIRRLELQLITDFESRDSARVIISDVRFQNEADWIVANNGVIIRLTRPGFDGKVGIQNHPSEAGIDLNKPQFIKGENYYEVINDQSIKYLHRRAETFAAEFTS